MKIRKKMAFLALMLGLALPLAYQTCAGMVPPSAAWLRSWQEVAFIALLLGFFIVSIMYMIGIGFNMPKMVAAARRDLMYMAFIAMLAGALYVVDNIMNDTFLPSFETQSIINPTAVRQGVTFCNYGATGTWNYLQQHTIDYSVCIRNKVADYFRNLMNINVVLGFVASINIMIYPLSLIGLGFSPGTAVKPLIDTMGYGLYMLALTIAQLKVQEVVLCFSKNYMFTIILPFGIALSAVSLTRSAGGALISLAIGFYIVLPITFLASEEIVQDYCAGHGNCQMNSLGSLGKFIGNAQDIANEMYGSEGQNSSELVMMLSLDGPFGPLVYITGIAATLLPMASLIISLLFVRSFAQIFGAEVDFSALIKLL